VSVAIVCLEYANGSPCGDAGKYLRTYDLDTSGPLGYGKFTWTRDPAQAARFPDNGAALAAWKATSTKYPTRPWDGAPNRPMTAYSITTAELP